MMMIVGYQTVCCWVLQLLMQEHRRARMDMSLQLLQHAANSGNFLLNIQTGHEIWFHNFDRKTK